MPTVVAGIDVGSLYTKALILDAEGKVLSFSILRSGAVFKGASEDSLDKALNSAGLKIGDVSYIVSTGYGRAMVPFANSQVTEISCHAKGIAQLFPQAHTVIDIGGQDSKVIYVNEGRAMNFVMNDKCAAGTGRFLEVMAGGLEVDLKEMGEMSLRSKKLLEVSSMCTVFAESEIISLFAGGQTKVDIAAAIFRAIARRIVGMVGQVGMRERVAMSGGVAKSIGAVKALEERLNTSLLIPEEPQVVGALGAALIATERTASTSFVP